jgi:hypothetical protein
LFFEKAKNQRKAIPAPGSTSFASVIEKLPRIDLSRCRVNRVWPSLLSPSPRCENNWKKMEFAFLRELNIGWRNFATYWNNDLFHNWFEWHIN